MKLDTVEGLHTEVLPQEGGDKTLHFALYAGDVDGKALLAGKTANHTVEKTDLGKLEPGNKVYFDAEGNHLPDMKQEKKFTEARRSSGSIRDPQAGRENF